MAAPVGTSVVKGQALNRPSFFNGSNYTYWKTRIRIYVHSIDYNLWKVVGKGPHIPSIVVNGIFIPKLEEDWDENDIKQSEINAKVMNLLYYALDPSEFNKISTCTSIKEIWDTLEVTHEGTDQVKNTKVNLLVHTNKIF